MTPSPCPFSVIRDGILEEIGNSLAVLRQSYDAHGLSVPFTDARKAYIEHLIVHVASKALNNNAKLVASLPVEALWCLHLFETESYRRLEQLVIDRLSSNSPISACGVQHIDHTALQDDESNTAERLQMTKAMYRLFNFEFLECPNVSSQADIGLNTFAARGLEGSSCLSDKRPNRDEKNEVKDYGSKLVKKNSEEIKSVLRSLDVRSIPDDIQPIENAENQTGFRGVYQKTGAKGKTVFNANITLNGQTYHVGTSDSARNAARLHAWAYKIFHEQQEPPNNLTEGVSEKNFQALQGINGDNIDCPETNEEDVMPEKGNKRRKLDLVKKITSLRIEDLPEHIVPIESKMNKHGYQGVGAVDKQYWWPKVQLHGKHYWLRPCTSLLDAAKLYAWAYEIIHGKEQLMIVQKNAKDENDKQKRSRTEETMSSKRQKTSDESINNKVCNEEKYWLDSKLKSLVIENLPKYITPIPSVRNKSGYKGVNETKDGKWIVDIYHEGRRIRVGGKFDSAHEAGRMYAGAFEVLNGSDNLRKLLSDTQKKWSTSGNKIGCVPDDEIMALLSSMDVKHLPSDIEPFLSKKNAGGCVGVERVKNQWAASVRFKGRRIRLGLFDTALDAGKMYAWGFKIIYGEDSLLDAYRKQDISFPARHRSLLRSSEPLKCVGDQGCQTTGCSEIAGAGLINQDDSNDKNVVVSGGITKLPIGTHVGLDSTDFGGQRVEEPSLKQSVHITIPRAMDTEAHKNNSSHRVDCHSNKNVESCDTSTKDFLVKDQQCREKNVLLRIRDAWNGIIEDKCFKAKRSTKVKKLMRTWFKCNNIEPCNSVGLFFEDRFMSFDEKLETFGIYDSAVLVVKKRSYESIHADAVPPELRT